MNIALQNNTLFSSALIGLLAYAFLQSTNNRSSLEISITVFVLALAIQMTFSSVQSELLSSSEFKSSNEVKTIIEPEDNLKNSEKPVLEKAQGSSINDSPSYYLLNNGVYSKKGIPYSKVSDMIEQSRMHDIHHQQAHVVNNELEKRVYFGKDRMPIYFAPTNETTSVS